MGSTKHDWGTKHACAAAAAAAGRGVGDAWARPVGVELEDTFDDDDDDGDDDPPALVHGLRKRFMPSPK